MMTDDCPDPLRRPTRAVSVLRADCCACWLAAWLVRLAQRPLPLCSQHVLQGLRTVLVRGSAASACVFPMLSLR